MNLNSFIIPDSFIKFIKANRQNLQSNDIDAILEDGASSNATAKYGDALPYGCVDLAQYFGIYCDAHGVSILEYMSFIPTFFYSNKYYTDKEIVLPDNIKTLQKCAFYDSPIKSLVMDGVVTIQDEAIKNCRKLEKCVLPEVLDYIGVEAFSGTGSLTTLTLNLPQYCAIDGDAFWGCDNLTLDCGDSSDMYDFCLKRFGKDVKEVI